MKTVLVAGQPGAFADEVRNQLDPKVFRVLPHMEIGAAEPLLRQGFVDLCLVDAEPESGQPLRVIEQIHSLAAQCPIFVYAGPQRQGWEEEAFLHGVVHVLPKPFRSCVLQALLARLWPEPAPVPPLPAPPVMGREPGLPSGASGSRQTLEVIRDFSGILCHSLCSEALLKQFLLQLREIIGFNRAVIFLRPPPAAHHTAPKLVEDRRMQAACSIGISSSLLQHFNLSLSSGIGGQVSRRGHILRTQSDAWQRDAEIRKEFELLGAEVAVPIWDRESLIGVAAFDGRVTGEPVTSEELSLIFLLLEQLGLALKNSWLHDQLSAGHQIMMDILNQSGSGCLVVGRNMEILHLNQTAQQLLANGKNRSRFEFADVPQPIASLVFEMLRTHQPQAPFVYRPLAPAGALYQIKLSLFQHKSNGAPNAVLVLVEDITQQEKARMFEVQSANHRLLKTMAAQLAHEIGNSLVPISTHQQLLPSRKGNAEFCLSLEKVLADGVRRIGRLSNQMLYLTMGDCERDANVTARELLEAAFAEAKGYFGATGGSLTIEEEPPVATLQVHRRAMQHALTEVLLNSLQANPAVPQVAAKIQLENLAVGGLAAVIQLTDNGEGFAEEAIYRAFDPFYTTRSVGLGLGLTVAGKIIEAHQGRIEIVTQPETRRGVVRISLPLTGANGGGAF